MWDNTWAGEVTMPISDKEKVDVMLKEYDTLRAEILQRMKTAFSHLGYAGALLGFALPYWSDRPGWGLFLALVGIAVLTWISIVNWSWLRRCAEHVRGIEVRINGIARHSEPLLSWEQTSDDISTFALFLPRTRKKRRNTAENGTVHGSAIKTPAATSLVTEPATQKPGAVQGADTFKAAIPSVAEPSKQAEL